MANLNRGFDTFAELDEALEAAALEILESTPAEVIHISDEQLELMTENILIDEEIKAERRQEMVGNYILGGIAALPVIGMLLLTILLFSGGVSQNQTIDCKGYEQDYSCLFDK
jgi:hypothetical protein